MEALEYHRSMKHVVVIVDGMGGGLGSQLATGLRKSFGDRVLIIALGTNASATERMLKAGADRGASGENAIKVSIGLGDYIMGPIGIAIADSMMGEVSQAIASAVLAARGERILLPVEQSHFTLVGVERKSTAALIADAIGILDKKLGNALEIPESHENKKTDADDRHPL